MVDSSNVLWGQTIVYTIYALIIIAAVGWFAYNLTRGSRRGRSWGWPPCRARCGALLLAALAAFLYNIVMTVGVKGAIGIFKRSQLDTREPTPSEV